MTGFWMKVPPGHPGRVHAVQFINKLFREHMVQSSYTAGQPRVLYSATQFINKLFRENMVQSSYTAGQPRVLDSAI